MRTAGELIEECGDEKILAPALRVTFEDAKVIHGTLKSHDPVAIQVSPDVMAGDWQMIPMVRDGIIYEWNAGHGIYPGQRLGVGVYHVAGIDTPLSCPLAFTGDDGFVRFQHGFCCDTPPTDEVTLDEIGGKLVSEVHVDSSIRSRACGQEYRDATASYLLYQIAAQCVTPAAPPTTSR